jgi:hypothetical protein
MNIKRLVTEINSCNYREMVRDYEINHSLKHIPEIYREEAFKAIKS